MCTLALIMAIYKSHIYFTTLVAAPAPASASSGFTHDDGQLPHRCATLRMSNNMLDKTQQKATRCPTHLPRTTK